VRIAGKERRVANPHEAIKLGIALVPEERRTLGLCTALPISANVPMMNYKTVVSSGLINNAKQGALARDYIQRLSISCRDENQSVAFVSGGNQQKVVLSKCLNAHADILLLDEPTRGVDVGAKQEIYSMIRELAREGHSVIVFSSELPEVLGLCDRIGLLCDGELKTILKNDDQLDHHAIMHVVTGGS
jgi:ribose transport system ATP-binding protein